MLSEKFPTSNYAEGVGENYNLCFSCHDISMIEEDLTEEAAEFRTNNKNLHFLHVNKKKIISCINCHDVHGSENAHLMTGEVRYGNWWMKLNYKKTETGGSCLPGCHKELSYKRE
ncbi:MAG: hypothetical protein KAR21_19835 [Spirochaetales bacterium]|nr:hypothetical protein [Spirochaetales bacterium]